MKKIHVLILAVALLALTGADCFLTSAQVLATFDLPNPVAIDAQDNFEIIPVDLTTIDEYNDNKDKLKGLTDVAVLGTFVNLGSAASPPGVDLPGEVTIYITPGPPTFVPSITTIVANAQRLWGPAAIGAPGTPEGTVTLGWDESAALFDNTGKDMLIDEGLGDGEFTLYSIGTGVGAQYAIDINDGFLVLVLDAGQ